MPSEIMPLNCKVDRDSTFVYDAAQSDIQWEGTLGNNCFEADDLQYYDLMTLVKLDATVKMWAWLIKEGTSGLCLAFLG